MRLDVYLAEQGLVKSRTRAQTLILEGNVTVGGVTVKKPSAEYTGGEIIVTEATLPFVGRGGLKLDAALGAFGIDVAGYIACDVGASSGGFTDCMLGRGARKVYAVDCGSGQLDPKLVCDERVVNIEKFNARYLDTSVIPEKCDIVTMDVSFISQTLIHPALTKIIRQGGSFVTLIKPQFEVGRAGLGKGGIVKKQSFIDAAKERVILGAKSCGFRFNAVMDSPILGGDGNREFIAYFTYEG